VNEEFYPQRPAYSHWKHDTLFHTACKLKKLCLHNFFVPGTPPTAGVDEDVGDKGTLVHFYGNASLYNHSGKKNWRLLKNRNIDLPYDSAIPLLGIYPK
jgi:hypothetical protein